MFYIQQVYCVSSAVCVALHLLFRHHVYRQRTLAILLVTSVGTPFFCPTVGYMYIGNIHIDVAPSVRNN